MTTDQHDSGPTLADEPPTQTGRTDSGAPAATVDLPLVDANLAGSLGEYTGAWVKRIRHGDAGILPVLAGLVVIVIIFQTQNSEFISAQNFANLLTQASFYILFGMAEVFVLLIGEIDLSTGYVAACGGAITCVLAGQPHNDSWWLSALVGLALCALIGVVQGLLVTRLRLPSFVVTLGGLLAFEGLLLFILDSWAPSSSGGTVAITNNVLLDLDSNSGSLSPIAGWIAMAALVVAFAGFVVIRDHRRRSSGLVAPPFTLSLAKIAAVAVAGVVVVAVCNINRGSPNGLVIEGVPWCVAIVLAIAVATTFLLGRTRFGRYVYAVGGNAEAARRAGINLNRIRLACFTLCSLMAGMAGLFYVSYTSSVSTSIDGGSLVLYAVAAAVIGGTSLFGGRGKIVYAVLGGLVIAVIYNGMGLVNLNTDIQFMVTALVLVAAATVDALSRRGRVVS
jgi:D-xylose transport system permease protein